MTSSTSNDLDVGLSVRRPYGLYLSLAWIALVAALAALAAWLPIADPNANVGLRIAPLQQWPEALGTDRFGRSVVSRLIFGARVSLLVGFLSATIGALIGVVLGMIAGLNKWAGELIGTLSDTVLAIPGIIMLIALRVSLGPDFGGPVLSAGLGSLMLGLAIVSVPPFVRVSTAATRQIAHREYVDAARLLGAGHLRVVTREILPGVARPVLAYGVVVFATLMVIEASASFLNLGVQLPTASWGGMIRDGQRDMQTHPQLVYLPAAVLFVTVLSIAAVGREFFRRASSGASTI